MTILNLTPPATGNLHLCVQLVLVRDLSCDGGKPS
jgi:hypothetical protein